MAIFWAHQSPEIPSVKLLIYDHTLSASFNWDIVCNITYIWQYPCRIIQLGYFMQHYLYMPIPLAHHSTGISLGYLLLHSPYKVIPLAHHSISTVLHTPPPVPLKVHLKWCLSWNHLVGNLWRRKRHPKSPIYPTNRFLSYPSFPRHLQNML